MEDLNDRERKVYDLVVKRFMASLFPAYEYEEMKIKAKVGSEVFAAKGKTVLHNGWKEVYGNSNSNSSSDDAIKDQTLPKLNKGDSIKITSLNATTGETKPPPPYNEATLLSAMESPVALGTVATRADIIEKLFNTAVIEKRGNEIFTTGKGRQLLALAPKELKSPQLTAEWEQKLTKISKGAMNKSQFINEIIRYTKSIISEIKVSQETFKHDNITSYKCPECGKFLLNIKGKKGTMLVCENRECKYRRSVSVLTNARCPNCHKKLELVGDGDNKKFVCPCGYREKLSAFEERRKKEGNSLSKNEVKDYLEKQKKVEKNKKPDVNEKLAAALQGIKFD